MEKRILILDTEFSNSLAFLSYYYSKKWKVFAGSPSYFPVSLFSKVPTIKYRYPSTGYLNGYGKSYLIKRSQVQFFISSIKKFIQRNQIKYVIPLFETTLIPISYNANKIEIERLYPRHEIIQILHDKSLLLSCMKKIRIKSFYIPSIYSMDSLNFPCIIRPTMGMGSYHIYVCNNFENVKRAISILKIYGRRPLIQKYLPSNERFSLNLLVNKNGEIVNLVSSLKVSKNKIKDIVKDLEKLFKKLGYFGFASPQFLIFNNNLYLTEINPRLSFGWYGLSIYPYFLDTFHKIFIEGAKKPKKRYLFVEKFHSFFNASKIYLKQTGDLLPFLKVFKDVIEARVTRLFGISENLQN